MHTLEEQTPNPKILGFMNGNKPWHYEELTSNCDHG
jgi:hypothetical protein